MKRGTKLVSDYLTDRKVDLLSKQRQFVAIDTANGNIVWLVGWEIDHRYCIKANTTRILQLHTKRKSDF
jgi:tRNA(Ile)-lysidine synthase